MKRGQVQFVDMRQRSVVALGNHAKNKSYFTGRERFDTRTSKKTGPTACVTGPVPVSFPQAGA
jgi:hypothetical protein